MKYLLLAVLMAASFTLSSQIKEQKKIFDDNFKKYSGRIDSLFNKYSQELDSLSKDKVKVIESKAESIYADHYKEQLEQTVTLQNSKDTYYGGIFTVIGILVTILVAVIGFNFFYSRAEAKRQVNALIENTSKLFEEQKKFYKEQFEALENKSHEFQAAYQNKLQDTLKDATQDFEDIKKSSTAGDKDKIESFEKRLKKLEQDVNYIPLFTGSPLVFEEPIKGSFGSKKYSAIFKEELKCKKCGELVEYNSLTDTVAKCKCGYANPIEFVYRPLK